MVTVRSRSIVGGFAVGLFSVLVLGANCSTIHPAEGPGTSYPCGIWGVECPGNACCPYKHECGGYRGYFTTCPLGSCCYIGGDDWPGAGGDAAARVPMLRPDGGAP